MAYEPPNMEISGTTPPDGYGAPTLPIGDTTGAGGLVASYRQAALKPSVEGYETEIPHADWSKTLIGVGIVTLLVLVTSLILKYVYAAIMPDLYDPDTIFNRFYTDVERNMRSVGADPAQVRGMLETLLSLAGGTDIWINVILVPVKFFVGAAATFLAARVFGGRGSGFSTHSYLLSLSYTPINIVRALLSLVPFVGGLISAGLLFYQFYLAGVSMQASQRMQPGKSMAAVFVPFAILLVLMCAGLVAIIAMFAAALQPR